MHIYILIKSLHLLKIMIGTLDRIVDVILSKYHASLKTYLEQKDILE